MMDQPGVSMAEGVLDYEALLSSVTPIDDWPPLAEDDAAAMCYTSGTTGSPKGVLYSHRALFLHTLALAMADAFALSERDRVMAIVPMFHANAWALPFAATMVGATQVYPGPAPQPTDLLELIQAQRVTFTAGVPTIWLNLLPLLETGQYDVSSLRAVVVGGSAAPRSMIETYEKRFGIRIVHAWGMTEMSPLGSICHLKSEMESLPEEERFTIRAKQGIPPVGVEVRVVDETGREVPRDGKTMGELQVRGPWVARAYYNSPSGQDAFSRDGWFRTGDVVTIDPEGYIHIQDRIKDLVKSGGEWISSVDLENVLMAHPKVLEAAVIAIPHKKWQERPLACVVPRPEHAATLTKEELLEFLRPRVAKWWLPDDIVLWIPSPKPASASSTRRSFGSASVSGRPVNIGDGWRAVLRPIAPELLAHPRRVVVDALAGKAFRRRVPGKRNNHVDVHPLPGRRMARPWPLMRAPHAGDLDDPLRADHDLLEVKPDVRERTEEARVEGSRPRMPLPALARRHYFVDAVLGQGIKKPLEVSPVLGEGMVLPELPDRTVEIGGDLPRQTVTDGETGELGHHNPSCKSPRGCDWPTPSAH